MVDKDFINTIKNHILVLKHVKLTREQEKKFLEEKKISKENLPRIRINDAAIVDLTPKLGEIIKIERKSATSGISLFYRVVSNE